MIDILYEDPTTLSAAAEELGLEILEAGPFGRAGGLEGVAANSEVVSAAFSDLVLAQRSVSDPVDIGTNHIVVILLKEHFPEAVKPLEEVRDEVAAAVRRQQAMDAAAAEAEELLARLDAGEDIDSLAETESVEVVRNGAALRTSPDIDADLRSGLFLMPAPAEGGVETDVVEMSDGYAVVRLESVTEGELAEDDVARRQMYARRIASASASEEMIGFVQLLREQSKIEVYEDRLQ